MQTYNLKNFNTFFDDIWTLDAHNDSCYGRIFFKDLIKEELLPFTAEEYFRVTFPALKEGNVRCMFVNTGDVGILASSAIIDHLYNLEKEKDIVSICFNKSDVNDAVKKDKIALILACEGSLLFLRRIDLLRNWHRLGVRVVSLTHGEGQEGLGEFAEMALAAEKIVKADTSMAAQVSVTADDYLELSQREHNRKKEKGITEFGKQILDELDSLNMLCDLSHANDATFWDAIRHSEGKLCCTHSNCAALCDHTRNLTDEMMEALADHGGVMGLCLYGEFIDKEKPSLERYTEHIIRALDMMGSDHVGIGTDYDGVPPGAFMAVDNPGEMRKLWELLAESGIKKSIIRKIAHENFLNLL